MRTKFSQGGNIMKNKMKVMLSLVLTVALVFAFVAVPVMADNDGANTASNGSALSASTYQYSIVHVDAGRKYFSPDNIKKIIDNAASAGFNQVELYLSDNQGFRFALDDMNITTSTGNTYDLTPALGDGYSDGSKYPDGSGKYLTQSEMDDIIQYAAEKNIEIVPCVNTPGHMGAILEEFPQFCYSDNKGTSKSSIDLENKEAVAFALAITEKYAAYFESKGVKYYSLGADEYANDLYLNYSKGGRGFGMLYDNDKYQEFVDYLNNAADIVIEKGMTPRAFNDAIYFNNDTSYNINKNIQVYYWENLNNDELVGPSATTIANQGHEMINANAEYYWALGSSYFHCTAEKAAGFDYTNFHGGYTLDHPVGAMFCIWCDNGAANGQDNGTAVVNATADVIAAFGKTLPTAPGNDSILPLPNFKASMKVGESQDLSLGESATWASSDEKVVTLASKTRAAGVTGTDVTATAVGEGKATITATTENGKKYSSDVMVAAAETNLQKTISLIVGGTETDVIEGADYTGNVDKTELKEAIATVSVNYSETPGGTGTPEKASSLKSGGKYIIGDGNGYYLKLSGTTISSVTDPAEATEFTITGSNGSWKLQSGNYYLRHRNNSLSASTTDNNNTWSYNSTGFYYNDNRYLNTNNSGTWRVSNNAESRQGAAYTVTPTEPTKTTTVTFEGKAAGTTYVTVGNTRYTINVSEEDLSQVTPLTVEYWITNVQATGKSSKAQSVNINAEQANDADGVELSTLIDAEATWQWSDDLVLWKSTRLTSDNKQTTAVNVDRTSSGDDFIYLRYWSSKWSFSNDRENWVDINNTDQIVAYYLQRTNITEEVTTLVKDWGYDHDTIQEFHDDNKNQEYYQVGLSLGVVYPSGQISPAEADFYKLSTIVYNLNQNQLTTGRDIGLLAFQNNSDYKVSKITLTRGRNTSDPKQTWQPDDTLAWNKKTDDNGNEWFDEIVVWDAETNGGEPMVNGAKDGYRWTEQNEAILLLIYLEPLEKEESLIVKYWDDTTNSEIYNYPINVKNVSGDPNKTFLNGLVPTLAENNGKLADDAYIVNSVGVHETFEKDLTKIPSLKGQYSNGFYQYTGADISNDGKTLTLHYSLKPDAFAKQYVVDFGLPLNLTAADFGITNPNNIESAEIISKQLYGKFSVDNANVTVVYTPSGVMKGVEVATLKLNYSDGSVSNNINFSIYPATSVYYEEGFATYSDTWAATSDNKGTVNQAASLVGSGANYGYDAAYSNATGNSNDTVATSNVAGSYADFEFTGTGADVYFQTNNVEDPATPEVVNNADTHPHFTAWVYKDGTLKEINYVDSNNAFTGTNANNGYNTPCYSYRGSEAGNYKITICVVDGTTSIDGYRVYNTLGKTHDVYKQDKEDNPELVEIRDLVIAKIGNNYNKAEVKDWHKAGEGLIKAVYDAAGESTHGAVILEDTTVDGDATVNTELIDIGPKNELYLKAGQTVAMTIKNVPTNGTVQVGMRSLTGTEVSYQINGEEAKQMNSAVDMFYPVTLGENGNLVITNNGSGILALTYLKVTAGADSGNAGTSSVEIISDANTMEYALKAIAGVTDDNNDNKNDVKFNDVPQGSWYENHVYDLVELGVIGGYPDGTFRPDGYVTRAEFTKMLAKAFAPEKDFQAYKVKQDFDDCKTSWAAGEIAWAKEMGIVKGVSATEFAPNAQITREQMATMLGRLEEFNLVKLKATEEEKTFTDSNKIQKYAKEYVTLLQKAGIIGGRTNGEFDPQGNTKRSEAAKMLNLILDFRTKI